MNAQHWPSAVVLAVALGATAAAQAASSQQVLYGTEGNRLRRYVIDSIDSPPLQQDVLVERNSLSPVVGRDVNGMICPFPDGSGRFVLGEDTGQPHPPAGWGIFSPYGRQIGKLTATYYAAQPEPFGCAFAPDGTLFTTSVGDQGFGFNNGQLIQWFAPYQGYPGEPGVYPLTDAPGTNFCKIAVDIGTTGGVAVDAQGRVYVAAASDLAVYRYLPPFPISLGQGGGCEAADALGSAMAENVVREVFLGAVGLSTYSGIVIGPNGNVFISEVLTGRIGEYDLDGNLIRYVLEPLSGLPPHATGTPQGISFDANGTLYYADLDLVGEFPDLGPGPDGKVWRITFDDLGDPNPPEIVQEGLAFPDGVAAVPGPTEWRTYAGGPRRQFFNHDESSITPDNVTDLLERWKFTADGIITGSPTLAAVFVPGEGLIQVVYFLSWDRKVYALRMKDGSELWSVLTEEQPGATFPTAASIDVTRVDGRDRVHIGSGEIMYSLDAATGAELWRFTAGTGCEDALGDPPGLCGPDGERNEIESSVIVADDKVLFGMDVNDVATGKGGFFAVDVRDGRMLWFFDLESGSTCTPDPADDIRNFDGYHSEAELGLPAGFFASRSGCNFPRSQNGCGNVWSSPALDEGRGMIYFASSNCDTDNDPLTNEPPPPMPPWDEAIVALNLDGTPAWRWRPREVDNDDLAFGGVPNLFSIIFGGASREVVGVGNKDGTYYVLDRDGVNEVTGVAWNDADPSQLPYWRRNVVPGGDIGGILATAAVDEVARRVYFSTAAGESGVNSPLNPSQLPFMHALVMDPPDAQGAVAWQFGPSGFGSFGPTSAIPGLVFIDQIFPSALRVYATDNDLGTQLLSLDLAALGNTSAPIFIDGTMLVGEGIGPGGTEDIASDLTAFCVPLTPGCAIAACSDLLDNDDDGAIDDGEDDGCIASEDTSEVLGDLDADQDVDGTDKNLVFIAIGHSTGDVEFIDSADFDRDGTVSWQDYQDWLAAYRSANAFGPSVPALEDGGLRLLGLALVATAVLALLRSRQGGRRGQRGGGGGR